MKEKLELASQPAHRTRRRGRRDEHQRGGVRDSVTYSSAWNVGSRRWNTAGNSWPGQRKKEGTPERLFSSVFSND
jgi:hypothetical protein